jgi:hypothetical protein
MRTSPWAPCTDTNSIMTRTWIVKHACINTELHGLKVNIGQYSSIIKNKIIIRQSQNKYTIYCSVNLWGWGGQIVNLSVG